LGLSGSKKHHVAIEGGRLERGVGAEPEICIPYSMHFDTARDLVELDLGQAIVAGR